MKNSKIILGILISTLMLGSCVKDLDLKPNDPSTILAPNITDSPENIKAALAKVYASFIISGQGGSGGDDITASDPNFFTTTRALWNVQEITTDEAICGWGDIGIADLNTQTWSSSNPFLTALYQRLSLSITYANQFIRITDGNSNSDIIRYNAEARFLRALAYYYYIDLFGNPPFTTEADEPGKFYPRQLDGDVAVARPMLFKYLVSQLKSIENKLGAPGFSYPQADQATCWMLLARLYLNAEVYTGTEKWDSCKIYTDKVVNSGAYSLATDYRQNFSADNDGQQNPEMIFGWAQDGIYTQGFVGTTFIIESSSDAVYLRAQDFHGLTNNTNWNGNRARKQFLFTMIDTLATYGGNPIPWSTDPFFEQCKDNRVYCRVKKSQDIPSPSSSGDYGIGIYKFTAKNTDGTLPVNYNDAYACTDFPIFRYADALLMRAEANYHLGNTGSAIDDINTVRRRAFGDDTGDITAETLTSNPNYILDERLREFYYEAQRRTDLIRFGQFTNGTLRWDWKGGVLNGASTSAHMNLFPIPGAEISANPFMVQNPDY